jgi:hypothetical protein
MTTLRTRLGALAFDVPRFAAAMAGRRRWIHMKNRREATSSDGRGVRCHWQHTSDLHIAKVFPSAGAALMRKAFAQWPIVLGSGTTGEGACRPTGAGAGAGAEASRGGTGAPACPQVSFIIGHRGLARLPHLLATLRSIAGQRDAAVECIVVEQAIDAEVESHLPPWVRYVHTPPPNAGYDYNRAWTLNAGARAARGELLILHDNDMLVPERYAAEALARMRDGFDFIDLKRFTFYLSEETTAGFFAGGPIPMQSSTIVQNLQGASIAASRTAYLAVGGFDESFVGWGGEDNEFWERAELGGRATTYGYLPFVHLFHAPQKGKLQGAAAPALQRWVELSAVPAAERMRRLVAAPPPSLR